MARSLEELQAVIGADAFRARVDAADREAAQLDEVLELVRGGMTRSAALRQVLSGCSVPSKQRRLRLYEAGGRDALVSRRYVAPAQLKMTEQVKGGLRVLAQTQPTASAEELAERLSAMFGDSFGTTVVQDSLRDLGLARPRGRPWWRKEGARKDDASGVVEVESLSLAGAELLKAVDEDCGAVAHLTAAMGAHLDALPPPVGPVKDDRGDRDERGRFLPSYNDAGPRLAEELGHKFNSVELQRTTKNLQEMRVVAESAEVRHRKNLGLVLLPVIIRGSRWSGLQHWRGELLEDVAGYAYQASTLDKYLRELKYSGASDSMRESVASFWLGQEGVTVDETTGAAVVYADAATKPLWTHHWTRASKVSKTGRVQPAVTTMTLHSGGGTPLVYRSFSGQASLPGNVLEFLREYERHAGEKTARRVIVMDREAHAVALFKALQPEWDFVVPLRDNVVGPNARFEDVQPWEPYLGGPDEVRDAKLWLNDSRPGEGPLQVRVVGRRRHRTGKVAWYATALPADTFPPSDVVRLYFERWPAQEHVYRDANGVVGLDAHHGYGKHQVDNIAVLDREEELQKQIGRLEARLERDEPHLSALLEDRRLYQEALDKSAPLIDRDRQDFDDTITAGEVPTELSSRHSFLRLWENWLESTKARVAGMTREVAKLQKAVDDAHALRVQKLAELDRLKSRRQIFTVDVELDEIMLAFKLTFMNLCAVLMTTMGVHMEIETLIDSVLTLPGERVTTATTEVVRIYRRPRDARAMAAVETACAELNSRDLRRGDRALRFEMCDPPPRRVIRSE
jgi:hypothetical protein